MDPDVPTHRALLKNSVGPDGPCLNGVAKKKKNVKLSYIKKERKNWLVRTSCTCINNANTHVPCLWTPCIKWISYLGS